MAAPTDELFDRSFDQVRRGDIRGALATLLDTLAIDPAHTGALQSAARICHMLGAPDDAQLFEQLAAHPDDPDACYGLGWRLVDQSRPDTGASLLEQALRHAPANTVIRRELAFARLHNHDYAGCLSALIPLQDEPDLAETERLDVVLLAAEAALYTGDREQCARLVANADEMVPDEEQRQRLDALALMLGRSRHWKQLATCGLREWHFIQHAGVILKTAGGHFETSEFAGRFGLLSLRMDMVAFLLQRLLHLLERLDHGLDTVVATSPTAAPLAHALAQRANLALSDEPTDPGEGNALLVAANAAEIGPLVDRLSHHTADLALFSLNLEWERDAPVRPDIVGVLSQRVLLPWEETLTLSPGGGDSQRVAADERPPEQIGELLVEAMDALPDDAGRARADFEAFYLPLRDELVLGNDQRYPDRRQFSHLSPCRPAASPDPESVRDGPHSGGNGSVAEPTDGGWIEEDLQ